MTELINSQSDALLMLNYSSLSDRLSGAAGDNRALGKVYIPANHDLEAIECWLARHPASSHTHRSYRREAERLLLWAIIERQAALSSLTLVDLAQYREFLKNPTPAERWISQSKSDKKPFTGPLSPKSLKLADSIIGSLFKFLVSQNYLAHNPHMGLPKIKDVKNGVIDTDRSLSKSQWDFILNYAKQQSQADDSIGKTQIKRLRVLFILSFLYATGLRIHEIAKAKVGDIERIERDKQIQVWLNVIGKGQKWRQVPLPDGLVRELDNLYTLVTGETCFNHQDNPIIPPINKRNGMTAEQFLTTEAIHKILKTFFKQVSAELAIEKPESALKIERATAHWLRHTHGSHAVNMNVPLPVLRDNLGHSNISVTSQYVHADKDERHNALMGMLEE